jgi:endonuclease-8
VLFLCGVHPFTPVSKVADLPKLIELAQRVLWANRDRAGQSATGSLRRGETNYVYSRTTQPCRRCRARIVKADQGIAPEARETYWCPRCQPELS